MHKVFFFFIYHNLYEKCKTRHFMSLPFGCRIHWRDSEIYYEAQCIYVTYRNN